MSATALSMAGAELPRFHITPGKALYTSWQRPNIEPDDSLQIFVNQNSRLIRNRVVGDPGPIASEHPSNAQRNLGLCCGVGSQIYGFPASGEFSDGSSRSMTRRGRAV